MRYILFALPIALTGTAAAAAPAPPPVQIQIPPELTDPAVADRVAASAEAMSKALLDLPVGEIQAAAEGRPVTEADRRRTVGGLDPNFGRDLQQGIAQSAPMIQQSMRAFAQALPAITKSLSDAANEVERAAANMPRPDYPRR